MAYSTNPNLPKARAIAMQLLVRDSVFVQSVANRCGVHRSTIWRWKCKWNDLNKDVQLTNDNRPGRSQANPSSSFRLAACTWRVPTTICRPRTSPTAVSQELVQADNGPEYSRYFEQTMKRANIQTRHSRLHRPNDNAFIERFNRTIQTECIGYYNTKGYT